MYAMKRIINKQESSTCIHFIIKISLSDLFSKLVPIPVYEALNAFENRKNQVISGEIGRLRESTTLMNR
jgi:signal recognition particle receptor subunit beta